MNKYICKSLKCFDMYEALMGEARGESFCFHNSNKGEHITDSFVCPNFSNTKEIAVKPIELKYDEEGQLEFYKCPNCKNQHSTNINGKVWWFNYCPQCGQHLDWSEVEEPYYEPIRFPVERYE